VGATPGSEVEVEVEEGEEEEAEKDLGSGGSDVARIEVATCSARVGSVDLKRMATRDDEAEAVGSARAARGAKRIKLGAADMVCSGSEKWWVKLEVVECACCISKDRV
jgi:hypothetical protein